MLESSNGIRRKKKQISPISLWWDNQEEQQSAFGTVILQHCLNQAGKLWKGKKEKEKDEFD